MVVKKAASYARLKATKARAHAKYMREKFKEHASTAIIAALSFLIALAWKDFIVKLIQNSTKISLLERYPYIAELYTAIIITVIAIIAIAIVSKWAQKPEQNNKNK